MRPYARFIAFARLVRPSLAVLLPALLAACASHPTTPQPTMPVMEEQEDYQAHARSHYSPPGTPDDPWGPYIDEASNRFDVPSAWIRAVMHQESGGHLYDSSGHFITSTPGAMGLMQIMPPAYDDLRAQYNLGPDPYNPRDNILAGTAYIRQMYEIYGSPGFLAAYNYGPGSLDHYLRQNRALPKETRNYVAAIAPHIMGIWPHQRSHNDLIVSRHDKAARIFAQRNANASPPSQAQIAHEAVQTAETQDIRAAWASRGFAPSPVQPVPPTSPPHKASPATPPAEEEDTLHIRSIPLADAREVSTSATDMPAESTHDWAIQLGSYGGKKQAQIVALKIRPRIGPTARNALIKVTSIRDRHGMLYRARLTNLTHLQAIGACKRLRGTIPCITVPPGSHF